MHFGTKRIKGLGFSTFLCVNFDFLLDFSSRKCTITCLTICMGRNDFFSQDFDVFWRENTLFLWRKIVFLRDFSEANVLKHCVFWLFLRDFLSWKKSSGKIDSGSVDEAFWRDFSCGNTWFWNEKEWFFSRFFNPLVYKERDFLFFFYTFFRVKKCMNTKLLYCIWIAILRRKKME